MNDEACSYDPNLQMAIDCIEEMVTNSAGGNSLSVHEVPCEEQLPNDYQGMETEQSCNKTCLICSSDLGLDMQCLSRGVQTFVEQCKILGRLDLCNYVEKNISKQLYLHKSCRLKWLKLSSKVAKETDAKKQADLQRCTRNKADKLDFKNVCFLCAKSILNCKPDEVRHVSTITIDDTIRHVIDLHGRDNWALAVLGRLESINDLRAADAVYHQSCYVRFNEKLPHTPKKVKRGRPSKAKVMEAFDLMCEDLEGECENEFYTLNVLHEKLLNHCTQLGIDKSEVYTKEYLKALLQKQYTDHIYFVSHSGREDVVGFKNFCDLVLRNQFMCSLSNVNGSEAEQVVTKAAMLILSEIRETEHDRNFYPSSKDIEGDGLLFLPNLLKVLMGHLIRDPLKQAGVGQAVMQAAKPRGCLMPLIFGVGVQLERNGQRQLQDELSRLGFSVSNHETRRFKFSVMHNLPSTNVTMTNHDDEVVNEPVAFTQYIADNFDHNTRTLDGHGTTHAMGVISATVCKEGCFGNVVSRVRRLEPTTATSAAAVKCVALVKFQDLGGMRLENMILSPLVSLRSPITIPFTLNVNNLWSYVDRQRDPSRPHPNWSGYMQYVCDGPHSGVAAVDMLTILDLNPSDHDCIFSTLVFVSDQAKALRLPDVSITFDQPLFIKAVDIAGAAKLNIVVRLGGFHLIMSYLGSIGKLMTGSGLEEVLAEMYGGNTIEHILGGKAYARAIRGHFIVTAALNQLLLDYLKNPCHTPTEDSERFVVLNNESAGALSGCLNENVVADLEALYERTMKDKICADNDYLIESDSLLTVSKRLDELKSALCEQSRTAKLWIAYMNYVDVVKTFLVAERTGNWSLHLETITNMLPLFAATGHANYAKSARVYVQQMRALPHEHPWLYHQFLEGKATVRRSNRFWAGLSTDLVIEQTLMKWGKSQGGLTRGRGVHETMRATWLSTLSDCAGIYAAMCKVTRTERKTEEHVEVGFSRMRRDLCDSNKTKSFFAKCSPFRYADNCRLISLSLGFAAEPEDEVNCDVADVVGYKLLQQWDCQPYKNITLKRVDGIKNLAHLNNKGVNKKAQINMDSTNLFHRLVIIGERIGSVRDCFSYELTPFPMSLFKCSVMHKPNKPALCEQFLIGLTSAVLPTTVRFVVDGGYLIHRTRWRASTDMQDILPLFKHYLSKFGPHVHVVFDGYDDKPSTKDHEHCRRAFKVSSIAPSREISYDTKQIGEQDAFLANKKNKKSFIDVLAKYLVDVGLAVSKAKDDADTDIVKVALKYACSEDKAVAVVAEDTDILVLLLHHTRTEMQDIYFVSEPKKVRGGKMTVGKTVRIRDVCSKVGVRACERMLAVHAFGGCDTTSAIFGLGKGRIYNYIAEHDRLHADCMILQSSSASVEDVCSAGIRLMIALHGGQVNDTLTSLRYAGYCKMSLSRRFLPERLPPSDDAARMHAQRVHYQSVVWSTLGETHLKPNDWGWQESNGKLVPIHLKGSVAPEHMLQFVRCSCKTKCVTTLCSCRRHGLECVSACKHCRGLDCSNACLDLTVTTAANEGEEVSCCQDLPDFLPDGSFHLQFDYEEEV